MGSIAQTYDAVRQRAREGLAGMWFRDSHLNRTDYGINQAPQRAQVSTVTVDSAPGDGTALALTIDGVSVTTVVPANGTTTTIAAAIAAAINAEALVRGTVTATSAAAVVTVTANWPGIAFSIASSEAFLTVATSSTALAADPVPFGAAVVSQGYRTDGEPERLVTLASETVFTPQVQTFTVATGAAVDIFVALYEVRGSERVLLGSDTVTGNATANTQATALRNAINAIAPTNTVVATGTAAAVICTAEIAGLEFDVVIAEVGTTKVLTTGPSPATSLHRAFVGVSYYAENQESPTIGGSSGEYRANEGVTYAKEGELWVSTTGTIVEGGDVYVELGTSNTGLLFPTAGADRVALSRARAQWLRASRDTGDNLAGVRLY